MGSTEMRNENTMHIDKASTYDILKMMNDEDRKLADIVEGQLKSIAAVVDKISESFNNGGRLIYIGAGSSGRLGVLDASECSITFGVSEGTVIGLIAGGEPALTHASEGEEDNKQAGIDDVKNIKINKNDIIIGISAAGNAAYVIGALEYAKTQGTYTVSLTCNTECKMNKIADRCIITETGAEVITGSTRLKAGTTQKLILDMISTGAMVKTGKVYENFMINLKPVNIKLRERCIRIISEITNSSKSEAEKALDESNGDIKGAIKIIKGNS